jgi:hypothetical protein
LTFRKSKKIRLFRCGQHVSAPWPQPFVKSNESGGLDCASAFARRTGTGRNLNNCLHTPLQLLARSAKRERAKLPRLQMAIGHARPYQYLCATLPAFRHRKQAHRNRRPARAPVYVSSPGPIVTPVASPPRMKRSGAVSCPVCRALAVATRPTGLR